MNPFTGHLALVIGHTRKRSGATGTYPISASEYEFNQGVADLVARFGESRGHRVATFYRDIIGIEGAYQQAAEWEPDAVIELHFNAFNGQVKGTETLYSDTDDAKRVMEKEFAEIVQRELCRVFNRKGKEDRGIKNRPLSRGERGYWNVNQLFGMPSILIEPFFGDNKQDARMAVENKQEMAEALVLAFEEWKQMIAVERGFIEAADLATPVTPATVDTPDTPTTPDSPSTAGTRRTRRRK